MVPKANDAGEGVGSGPPPNCPVPRRSASACTASYVRLGRTGMSAVDLGPCVESGSTWSNIVWQVETRL